MSTEFKIVTHNPQRKKVEQKKSSKKIPPTNAKRHVPHIHDIFTSSSQYKSGPRSRFAEENFYIARDLLVKLFQYSEHTFYLRALRIKYIYSLPCTQLASQEVKCLRKV